MHEQIVSHLTSPAFWIHQHFGLVNRQQTSNTLLSSFVVMMRELDNIAEELRVHRALIDGGTGNTQRSEVRASHKALIEHRQQRDEKSFDAADQVSELVDHAAAHDFAEIRKAGDEQTNKAQMRHALKLSKSVQKSKSKIRSQLMSLDEVDTANSGPYGAPLPLCVP